MKYYDNYLEHHGINGQRWGVKNGPPYPLDYKSHSLKEKRMNNKNIIDGRNDVKKHSNNDDQNDGNKSKKSSNETRNKILKTAGITLGVAATAYLGYKLYNSPTARAKLANTISKYGNTKMSDITKNVVNKVDNKIDDLPKSLGSKETIQAMQDKGVKLINNGAGESIEDTVFWANKSSYGLTEGRHHNCISCAMDTEMRMRGYDVVAKEQIESYNPMNAAKVFGKPQRFRGDTIEDLEKTLSMDGPGSRGIILGTFKDEKQGIHAFNYVIDEDNVVYFSDGQQNWADSEFSYIFDDDSLFDFKKTMFTPTKKGDELVEPNVDILMNYVEPNDGGYYDIDDDLADKWRENIPKKYSVKDEKIGGYVVRRGTRYIEGI